MDCDREEPDAAIRPQRPSRRALGIAVVAVCAAIAALIWAAFRPSGEARTPIFLDVSAAGFKQYSNSAISPDGRWIAYSLSDDGANMQLRSIDTFDVQDIPGTANANNPFFSPDGRWMAIFDNSTDGLAKVSIKGGNLQQIPGFLVGGSFNSGAWHDSGIIVVTSAIIDGKAWFGLASAPDSGGDATILTTLEGDEVMHSAPVAVPGSEWVLFNAEKQVTTDVWAVSLKTRERKLVVRGASTPMVADGNRLFVFRVEQQSVATYPFNPSSAEIEGDPQVVLTAVGTNARDGGRYAVSQSGTLIYNPLGGNSSEGRNTLVWVDRNGQMTEVVAERSSWRQPRLSPDGRRIILRRVLTPECDLWAYDLERKTLTRISFEHDTHDPLWGPTGETVQYAGDTDPLRRLFEIGIDGSGSPSLVAGAASSLRPTGWSDDGRRLALSVAGPSNTGDVWVLDLDVGEEPRPFLETRFAERFPSFSPDGRWLSYASDESGRLEVYARPYPGPGGRIQVSVDGGSEPLWTRDGTEIFFRSNDAMMVVPIQESGAELVIGQPKRLFEDPYLHPSPITPEAHSYDRSLDGQRLLMIQPAESEAQDVDLRIVLDWTRQLGTD